MKLRGVAAGAAMILAFGGTAFAGALPVEALTITRTTKDYDIDASYLRTGLAPIDNVIAAWVNDAVDEFVKTAEEDFASYAADGGAPEWMHYDLELDNEIERNDDAMFVALFNQSVAAGGAHPNHFYRTFNFLRPDGWQVYLPEIFDERGLKRISALAIADLTRQLMGPDSMSDTDWIKAGAGPEWGNFSDFLLLPDKLVIEFPAYQVAAYVAGGQEVEIPLTELAPFMRQDWRQPVASFDCAKAGTAVEKAICGNVALARLDRELAAAYGSKLKYAADDAARDTIRSAQRAWIKQRDAACGGSADCLADMYKARLDALSQS